MILLVTYDLHNRNRDYASISATLEKADAWARSLESVWFLDTIDTPAVWRDRLKSAGDANDEYFVVRLQKHWAAFNVDQDVAAWLKDVHRRWD